jgi:hypothetical protein
MVASQLFGMLSECRQVHGAFVWKRAQFSLIRYRLFKTIFVDEVCLLHLIKHLKSLALIICIR